VTFELFKWFVAVASLVGVMLNIHHQRSCFLVWGFTNFSWTVVDAWHQVYAQAALQTVYCGLSVYGWIKWRVATHA